MKARSRWLQGTAFVLFQLAGCVALADGLIVIHHEPGDIIRPPPGPREPPPHYVFAPLEVKYHHVDVKITDQVAETAVDQIFYNPNDRRLEGTYLFPLPPGAHIDRFAMEIDGKNVEAELLDADKARRLYEDIVRKMRDPALLEYAGQGLFKVRVYPIEARGEKRIRMKYTQLLRSDGGMVEYVYPLNTEKFSAQPLKSVVVRVELECQPALRTVYSPSHPVEIKRAGEQRATVAYEASNVKPDADFHLLYAAAQTAGVVLNLLTHPEPGVTNAGHFVLFATPPVDTATVAVVEKDVVFVLDTSGSMLDQGKLDKAREALRFCLHSLPAGDRFELLRFATEVEALFGGLTANEPASRQKAEDFLGGLKALGGTALEEALLKAVSVAGTNGPAARPCFVVLLTDGLPTVGNTDAETIVRNVRAALGPRPLRIFCFGIGTDVNTHLLDRLTEETRAASQYVLPGEDLEVKVSNFYAKINAPVLTDLTLTFSGGMQARQMHPTVLPDLFRGEQLVVFGRYTGQGPVAVALEGVTGGQKRRFATETTLAERGTGHEFIPRLWAVRRVGFLLDQLRLHGENKELRDEVTELARRYGIVTPYTAHLILEDEQRRNVPEDRRLMTVLRDGEARRAAARMYDGLREEVSGVAAFGGALALDTMKAAADYSAPAKAQTYLAGAAPGLHDVNATTVARALGAQPVRHVAGRTFYLNGNRWVDAEVPSHPDAQRMEVKFGSEEYFALLTGHPDAAPWFAVGTCLQLWLDGMVYEIIE